MAKPDPIEKEVAEAPGVYCYTPEMGGQKPECQMEASRGYYGKHWFIDTPLELKGRGIELIKKYQEKDFCSKDHRVGWNEYRVTDRAFEKLKEKYSTQRPVMPGGYPKPQNNEVLEIENFDNKKFVEEVGCQAWGYVEYEKPLGHFDVVGYELVAVKIKTLHLKYIGRDDWGRYVYEDENGKLWKNTDCCSPRECCEERGDTLNSAAGNKFDGEPDCFMAAHIKVEYLPEEGGEQDG